MKRLFTLLTLALYLCGSAWAEDVTIFSANPTAAWSVPASTTEAEITSSYATITGGKMYVTNKQTSAKDLIKKQGELAFQQTNNDTFFKVVLDKALEAGDVISARMQSRTDADLGLWFSTASSRPNECTAKIDLATATSQAWVKAPTYTVEADDGICGETTFYIYRATGKSTYFNTFTITRTMSDRADVTLGFSSATASATLGETFSAPTLTVAPAAAADEVAYASSNEAVATVAADGSVTIKAAGTTTISAAISGSQTYKDASASYTLTVTDPNVKTVTATWAFNTGLAGQTATFGPEQAADYFYANGTVVLGSNLSYNGTQDLKANNTANGEKSTKIRIAADASTDANIISFTIKPRKGVTFTPTAVSFYATRCGTDGGKMTISWYDANSSTSQLGTAAAAKSGDGLTDPARDNNATQNWTEYSYDLKAKGAAATTGECGLKILLYSISGKDYALSNIVIEGEYSGAPEAETMYTVTTSVNPEGAGTISQTPSGESIAEGTAVTFSATANTGYAFLNKWTVDGNEVEGATYTIDALAANTEVVAQFKQLYAIDYDKSGEGLLVGTSDKVLTTEYAGADDKFTAPACLYMAKEGFTFSHWTDGDANAYTPGTMYTLTNDITLTPQFVANSASLTKSLSATTVTWNFGSHYVRFNSEGNTQYYVQQATIDGVKLDVPMFCDQTAGKLNNSTRTDEWAQANGGTKLTIPAVSGMKIVAKGYNQFSSTTIAGAADYEATSKSPFTATYTYTGTDATIDIVVGSDISYLSSVAVTYPKTMTYVDVTTDAGYRTFASSSALDFSTPIEGLTAYRATVGTDKRVSFTAIDGPVPAGEGMLIKAAEGRYYIPVAAGTPADIDNALVGVTTATEVEAGTFVLLKSDLGVGFHKTTSAFTVGANTAYLPASVVNEARTFIGFEDATAIEGVAATKENGAEVYNLQGQRVTKAQKGLYIVNGKKMVIK